MTKKFTAELWDGSEYIITGPSGPIGNKISNRKSAQDIADWLNLNLETLKKLEKEDLKHEFTR